MLSKCLNSFSCELLTGQKSGGNNPKRAAGPQGAAPQPQWKDDRVGSLGPKAHLSLGLRGRSTVTGHLPEPGFFSHEAENITTLPQAHHRAERRIGPSSSPASQVLNRHLQVKIRPCTKSTRLTIVVAWRRTQMPKETTPPGLPSRRTWAGKGAAATGSPGPAATSSGLRARPPGQLGK